MDTCYKSDSSREECVPSGSCIYASWAHRLKLEAPTINLLISPIKLRPARGILLGLQTQNKKKSGEIPSDKGPDHLNSVLLDIEFNFTTSKRTTFQKLNIAIILTRSVASSSNITALKFQTAKWS